MFGWGKPKKSLFGVPYPLTFKSAEAAIEYSSAYMKCKLYSGVCLPAVVLDPREYLGTKNAVFERDDGIQTAWIRVAGENGGFDCVAQTSGAQGPRLQPGDMVFWRAFKHKADLTEAFGDSRSGWVGLIVGTLAPELNAEGWKGLERFYD